MADPITQTPGGGNLLKGNPSGTPRRRKAVEGEDYARDILVQDDEDILVTKVDEVGEVEMDRHAKAVADPVYRALRRQARAGVGNIPGQLPPAVFSSLADRAFGKVMDRVKINAGGRPFAAETEEQLHERLREKLAVLDGLKREAA